jgi:stage V sporulation protein B
MLTEEEMGIYGLLMPVYAVLNAGTLSGFSLAAARTTADFVGSREESLRRASQTVHAALQIYLLCFCIVAIPYALLSGKLAKLLGESGLQTALLLLLPCLLMTAFENILKSVFQGLKNVLPSMLSESCEQLVRIGAVALFLTLLRGKANIPAAIVCGMMVSEVASDLILGLFAGGILRRGAKEASSLYPTILRCALPVCAGNACGMLLASVSGTMLPAALTQYGFSSADALAAYGTLSGMLLPLLNFPGALIAPLNTVMLPRITQAAAAGDFPRLRRRAGCTILADALLAASFEGAAVVFAAPLCKLLFDTAAPAGIENLLELGIAAFASLAAAGSSCVLNALGRQKFLVLFGIFSGAVELPLLYLAAANAGIAGYARVSALLGVLQGILLTAAARRYLSARKGAGNKISVKHKSTTPI